MIIRRFIIAVALLTLALAPGCSDETEPPPPPVLTLDTTVSLVTLDDTLAMRVDLEIQHVDGAAAYYTPFLYLTTIRDAHGQIIDRGLAVPCVVPPQPWSATLEPGGSLTRTLEWDGWHLTEQGEFVMAEPGTYRFETSFGFRAQPDEEPTERLTDELTLEWPGP